MIRHLAIVTIATAASIPLGRLVGTALFVQHSGIDIRTLGPDPWANDTRKD